MGRFPMAGAALLALALTAGAVAPAYADDTGAAIAGGVAGFMAGALAAGQGPVVVVPDRGPPPPPPRRYDRGWRAHVAACDDRWGDRYDPRSDLVHWRGRVFPCDEGRFAPPPPPPRRFYRDYGPGSGY